MPDPARRSSLAALGPELREAFARRAGPDGFLPFDRFMDVALYGPGVGYYVRDRPPFGPTGDFYTAPRVHPLFARTLATHVAEVRRALGGPSPFRLVDLGSGDGRLLAGIVEALGERHAAEGVDAVVADRAAARRSASLDAVGPVARNAGARAGSVGSLAELGPFHGLVLAHELLDAQPVRRLRWSGTGWNEVGYRLAGDGLEPAEASLRLAVPPPALPTPGADDAGLTVEIAPAAEAIVREVGDHLAGGSFVVVDFGAEETELLAGHRRGTVAAVRAHRSGTVDEAVPGSSDLSAFVNFTRVRAAARAAGLIELAYRPQADALAAWGFAADLEQALQGCGSAEDGVRLRLAAKNLLFGFGTFRVLELAAPASAAALAGLSGASRPAR